MLSIRSGFCGGSGPRKIDGHAALASLERLAELHGILARRAENFNRAMTIGEKKLLEAMLERGLGVQRKKPVTTNAVTKKRQLRE